MVVFASISLFLAHQWKVREAPWPGLKVDLPGPLKPYPRLSKATGIYAAGASGGNTFGRLGIQLGGVHLKKGHTYPLLLADRSYVAVVAKQHGWRIVPGKGIAHPIPVGDSSEMRTALGRGKDGDYIIAVIGVTKKHDAWNLLMWWPYQDRQAAEVSFRILRSLK